VCIIHSNIFGRYQALNPVINQLLLRVIDLQPDQHRARPPVVLLKRPRKSRLNDHLPSLQLNLHQRHHKSHPMSPVAHPLSDQLSFRQEVLLDDPHDHPLLPRQDFLRLNLPLLPLGTPLHVLQVFLRERPPQNLLSNPP
jgi:hypothetical protein